MGNPFAGTEFSATGTATHLGKFDGVGFVTFDVLGDGTIAATGDITFIAANGDELDAEFAGTLDPVTGVGTATFVFTGGTGRFAGAAGGFEADIVQDGAGFLFTVAGTISY